MTVSFEELYERRLPLAGTFNVRDVGGYATADGRRLARGRLLRGDSLHRVDDAGRKTLAEFGLRTSVDLREDEERRDAPDALGEAVRTVAIPIFSHVPDGVGPEQLPEIDRSSLTNLEALYRALVTCRGPVIVAALRELLRPGALPAIVHCTAGKDRTGIVIAIALDVAGVPTEVIAMDYAATALFLSEDFREAVRSQTATFGLDPLRVAALLQCEPQLITTVLEEIRAEHGNVDGYLVHHGMASEEIEQLRALLLEEEPARER